MLLQKELPDSEGIWVENIIFREKILGITVVSGNTVMKLYNHYMSWFMAWNVSLLRVLLFLLGSIHEVFLCYENKHKFVYEMLQCPQRMCMKAASTHTEQSLIIVHLDYSPNFLSVKKFLQKCWKLIGKFGVKRREWSKC